ncbi:hypothetical protein AeMF1_018893 [Aphanomyces euteiches]|nr:hypothetical protein AeMF1_018893 [Aphanomyces euteiches]KAH9187403.1 hypothetical protein AeNC1_010624 [Aphanomyces euteiches]
METTNIDNDLDLLHDLQFLIANDDQLQDDLANVCDLLLDDPSRSVDEDSIATNAVLNPPSTASPEHNHSTTTSATLPPRRQKTKEPRRFEVRQRQEIFLLRHQVEVLKSQLKTHGKRELAPPSKWENIAKTESIEKEYAFRENERLKEVVHQQATFIEHMEKFCRKRPRLSTHDMQSEEWQSYRLAAQQSLRVAPIHAIADRQLRRMQSTFIKAGVFDATKFILRAEIVPQPGNSGRFEFANNIVLDAPFDTIATATWHVLATKTPVELPEGVAEVIDDHTIYMMQTDAYRRSYCNTIRKRYIEHDRHVIIQRTVQEDALMPHMNRGAVENKSVWMEFTPLPDDPTKCRLTMVLYLELGQLPSKSDPVMEMMESIVERFSIAHRPTIPGTFPPAIFTDIDTTTIPYNRSQNARSS